MTTTYDDSIATDALRHRLNAANVPVRLRAFDDVSLPEPVQSWLDSLHNFYVTPERPLDEYPDDPSGIGRGLAWVGPPGTGKTTQAVAALIRAQKIMGHRHWVHYVQFNEYLSMMKRQWSLVPQSPEWLAIEQTLRDVEDVAILLIDDVGKEVEREGGIKVGAQELDRLLRLRHSDGSPTFITTNIKGTEAWSEKYGDPMASFVKDAFVWIPTEGRDRRKARS